MGLRVAKKYGLPLLLFSFGFILISSKISTFRNAENESIVLRDALNRRQFEEHLNEELLKKQADENGTDINEYRRNFVKKMMKFAWSNYRQYAWGHNELRPLSKIGHSTSVFGRANIGATIVDAVDTLYIMGLKDEFEDAKKWITESFNMKLAVGEISVFETTIRYVGGFLSTYALSGEEIFLRRAKEVADLLLPAFNTPTGIPQALVNMRTGQASNYGWASGGCSILSEFGTLELEFDYLSSVTRNFTYMEKVKPIRKLLNELDKPNGLYPLYLNPKSGKFCSKQFSIGALGDSFYEYLLKVWLFHNRTDTALKQNYDETMNAIEKNLLFKSKPSELWYFAEMKGSRIEHKMDHLACFIAGLYAMQSKYETDPEKKRHALEIGEQIGNTCHEGYIRTVTGIGPESMRFISQAMEAKTNRDSEMYYILRPEVVEGWFVLYRVTGNPKYREWCWTFVLALERHCRTPNGYSGIRNVYNTGRADQDDVQQSFFLSETLKYLYLVFSDPTVISFDEWVLNTEAHPFPIQRD